MVLSACLYVSVQQCLQGGDNETDERAEAEAEAEEERKKEQRGSALERVGWLQWQWQLQIGNYAGQAVSRVLYDNLLEHKSHQQI